MRFHVFNDSHGHFLNATVERFDKAGMLTHNTFVNLTQQTSYANKHVIYLRKNCRAYRKFIREYGNIQLVTFYPYDDLGAWFLKELVEVHREVKVQWVFWSYEYYHQYANFTSLLDPFSLAYYKNRPVHSSMKNAVASLVKKVMHIPYYNRKVLAKGHNRFSVFYSFLPQDFIEVRNNIVNDSIIYRPISFLSIEQIVEGVSIKPQTSTIMIGHAATITANHIEVLKKLSCMKIANKLFIPLEYGDMKYAAQVKFMAKSLFSNCVEVLETRRTMHEYYTKLSTVGFAIFNFKKQEALGNLLFLLWNGAKVFLAEESTAYKQFKTWGLSLFSLADISAVSLSELLPEESALKNKSILTNLFAEEKLQEYWKPLMY
jgi:hypothetical protein